MNAGFPVIVHGVKIQIRSTWGFHIESSFGHLLGSLSLKRLSSSTNPCVNPKVVQHELQTKTQYQFYKAISISNLLPVPELFTVPHFQLG